MDVGGRSLRSGGRRSARRAMAVALGVVVAAAIAGCATSSRVVVGAPSSPEVSSAPSVSEPSPAGGEAVPAVGECRGPVDIQIIDAAADPRPATACDGTHGTETFWVGEMDPAIDAWPGDDDQAGGVLDRQVDRECASRHLDYLGFDPTVLPNLPPDRLQIFAFYIPTEADFADGARWFRCDALVEPLTAGETTTIEGTLKGVYGQVVPVAYRLCEARLGQSVACDQEHEIEYLASVVLDDVTEYPLQRGDLEVTAACRTPLLQALGLTEERTDLVFGYLLPTKETWDVGSHGATCVVGAADGSPLTGSLAGIGPNATLPVSSG